MSNYPSPLLPGAVYAVPSGDVAGPVVIAPPPVTKPKYLSETADYGLFILPVKNELVQAGWQNVYAVVHKQHDVIAAEAKTLAFAMELMFAAQESIDKAPWADGAGTHGAN